MGVMAGDIIVAEFPATINLAIYMQYFAAPDDAGKISFEFRLMQDDTEMVNGKMEADVSETKIVNLIFPRALATFDKEKTFKIFVKLNGAEEREILSRKIAKGNVS